MALDSTTTLTTALAQLNNNLAWDGSPTKAAEALEAVRWLLFNRPQYSMESGSQLNFEKLAKLETSLESYVNATKTNTSQAHFVRGRPM